MIELATVAVDDCWNRIGVGGDRSCPELPEHVHCSNCPVFARAARSFFDRPAPTDYLAEWNEYLSKPEDWEDQARVGVVVFRLGDEWLALATRALVEITQTRPAHRVPHRSNRVFLGLVNIRGQLHLLMSLHGLLGVTPDPAGSPAKRLLVVEHKGDRWVFAADEVRTVERVQLDQLGKVPGTLANPAHSFTQAVFAWQDRHVGFLDEQRLVAAFRSLGQ